MLTGKGEMETVGSLMRDKPDGKASVGTGG